MAILALAAVGGPALQLQQAALWDPSSYAGVLGGALLAAAAMWRVRRRPVGLAGLAAGIAAAAFAATGLRAGERLADALPAALEGRDLVLTGTIAGLPREAIHGTRFVFAVESARLPGGEPVDVPGRVSLGWYRGFDGEALLQAPRAELRAGERWRLPVRLRRPHGPLNPHGFDTELWLWEDGIRASGSVRVTSASPAERLEADAAHPVERLRERVRRAIDRAVDDPRAAGVLAALAVGDQAAIEREDWELFRATGIAHLMSISGLHVTMFAWLAGGLIGWAWRRSPRLMLAAPAPQAARWGALAAAAGYALLAGWGVPAQRTVGMVAVVVLLRSLGWRWPSLLVLLAAGTAVVLADPWALLQPGFWLSFVAVGLLMASEPATAPALTSEVATSALLPRRLATNPISPALRTSLRAGLRTQVVASVGLAPLGMVFFQQVSVVGFVANLVAIPLVTLLVTPLAMLGMLVPWLWVPAAALVQALGAVLGWLVQAPLAVWTAAAAPAWAAAAGLLGGALLVMPLPVRLRALGLPLLLPLLFPPVERPPPGAFEFVAADIGQGTAVLVRTRHHLLLYDTGPTYSPEADAGQRVLLPLLRARGERAIDLLVLSHRDTDHVGGAASILAALPVRAVTSSLEAAHPLRATAQPPHDRCQAGQRWSWDGVSFEVLHPPAGEPAASARPNTLSCVLRVEAADGTGLLLTGDIESAQEASLAASGARLRSTYLLVPHHGSRTSSTAGFLATVAPATALVQAGYRSRFGHPAPEVVARYEAQGIRVVRSDRCGAFSRAADGRTACERQVSRRYWHHPAAAETPARP